MQSLPRPEPSCVCVCDKPITNTHRHPIEILVPISAKKSKIKNQKEEKNTPKKSKLQPISNVRLLFFSSSLKSLGGLA